MKYRNRGSEESDKNLLLQEISILRYLYDRGLSNTQTQDFKNALDSVHKILITMKVENDKKMGVSTMRLLEVLDECNESDISKSMQFSGLISTINNQIMNTKGRNNSAMNNRLVESLMTKDQKAYAYKYLETLKALIIKYRIVLSSLFPEYPNERVKPTDTIQNRIIFIYQIISYLYRKDVENSPNSDMPLIGIKTKTQLPTIFHQIIMDTNLFSILKIIANQENFDMSNVGSLAYPFSKPALDNYIQDLYHKLMGTRTNRS